MNDSVPIIAFFMSMHPNFKSKNWVGHFDSSCASSKEDPSTEECRRNLKWFSLKESDSHNYTTEKSFVWSRMQDMHHLLVKNCVFSVLIRKQWKKMSQLNPFEHRQTMISSTYYWSDKKSTVVNKKGTYKWGNPTLIVSRYSLASTLMITLSKTSWLSVLSSSNEGFSRIFLNKRLWISYKTQKSMFPEIY